jgi:hypothetical protein
MHFIVSALIDQGQRRQSQNSTINRLIERVFRCEFAENVFFDERQISSVASIHAGQTVSTRLQFCHPVDNGHTITLRVSVLTSTDVYNICYIHSYIQQIAYNEALMLFNLNML